MNTAYLQHIAEASGNPAILLADPSFLRAQQLFFSVVQSLGGRVDFDIADMREVHAVAALGEEVRGKRVLDIGCGSTEGYVLGDEFREHYPPFFAEMLVRVGAQVTGVDIRPNPSASYDHKVADIADPQWTASVEPPYDIVACFSLFNAPGSPFEKDAKLCDRLVKDMRSLLKKDGLLIATLRDELFEGKGWEDRAKQYLQECGFALVHCSGNCVWATVI